MVLVDPEACLALRSLQCSLFFSQVTRLPPSVLYDIWPIIFKMRLLRICLHCKSRHIYTCGGECDPGTNALKSSPSLFGVHPFTVDNPLNLISFLLCLPFLPHTYHHSSALCYVINLISKEAKIYVSDLYFIKRPCNILHYLLLPRCFFLITYYPYV